MDTIISFSIIVLKLLAICAIVVCAFVIGLFAIHMIVRAGATGFFAVKRRYEMKGEVRDE